MNIEYYKEFSHELNRDMEFKVYGHGGTPCLVFPAQDGRFYDFENFGMIASSADYIDAGRVQFFCCDCIDAETWSFADGDPRERMEQHERWFHYIVDELVPRIKEINPSQNGIITCGCSLGAFHALNFMLRRPDLFRKVLGMSGLYRADYFFHAYHDELTYNNSPYQYLPRLPQEHDKMALYRTSEIILCCGKGAWEQEMEDSLHQMEEIFTNQKIDAWIDYWGYDVSHDWLWWKKQLYYFLQFLV